MTTSAPTRWYKDAVIYQTHVRAFADSRDDGIGDFRGLTSKLDYIQDLGVTAIWLLPFYPSPLRDDGYDIADYTDVNPVYGDLSEFRLFLRAAHARGLRVITELVLNHTSDEHEWFRSAVRAPASSRERDFYVWSDSAELYPEARVIFKDFEKSNWTWHDVAGAYYWHRFYSHQPDLNYDSPDVQKAMLRVLDFWLRMGVDGVRLDAVPYLFERAGTSCENLPETHAYLRKLRSYIDSKYPDRMLLAEANQWPEEAVAYFGQGDECHMAFHFPVMPRLFMAVQQEDRVPILDILQQTPPIPETCQWTLFLRNHDELTLEMVTDEERDYMYRAYARDPKSRINLGIRRRLAPLLGNNRRKIELLNGLLMSLPGTPVIYYGDELGMGDNIYLGDRDSVRTPMQWSADRNAGFTRANPQKLYLPVVADPEFHYTAVNVETQQNNQHSVLWWMKRLISLRKRHLAFSRGILEFLTPDNTKVVVFIRRYEGEVILVAANLSRFAQYVELNLSEFVGVAPVEIFGQTRFPRIGESPYVLTLGPHTFYWFSLSGGTQTSSAASRDSVVRCQVKHGWDEVFNLACGQQVEGAVSAFLKRHSLCHGHGRVVHRSEILDVVPLGDTRDMTTPRLVLVRVAFTEGEPEYFTLPLAFAAYPAAEQLLTTTPDRVLVQIKSRNEGRDGVVYDASRDPLLWTHLYELIARGRRIETGRGGLAGWHNARFRRARGELSISTVANPLSTEVSHHVVIVANQLILKLFRKVEPGINPEVEIGQHLTERVQFPNTPATTGWVDYLSPGCDPVTIAVLHEYRANAPTAWEYTVHEVGRYFDSVGTEMPVSELLREFSSATRFHELIDQEPTKLAREAIGPFLLSAGLLGKRTAELHRAMAVADEDSSFRPEPFTSISQRSLYQSLRNRTQRVLATLRRQLPQIPESARAEAVAVVNRESQILRRFRQVTERRLASCRIRCHGDYRLGQVLFDGKDFIIIDFEGEASRAMSERRIKRSPLSDVACMLRSLHHASHTGLLEEVPGVVVRTQDTTPVAQWADFWCAWTSAAFVRAYLDQMEDAHFLPRSREECTLLLDLFLLEQAIRELDDALRCWPDRGLLSIRGILELSDGLPG